VCIPHGATAYETPEIDPRSHLKSRSVQLVGIVYDQPNEQAAIKHALEEFEVPPNQHGRLLSRGSRQPPPPSGRWNRR
jgi:hypothetical protein